jgi:hypothetical protein
LLGALTTVTTTSVRKALTIMLSFLVFPKPVDAAYMMGVMFVLVGLALNVMIKAYEKKDKQENSSADANNDEATGKDKDGTLNV